jgi:NADPH:quinone reductase-like Zn-dependent oxidoreductase
MFEFPASGLQLRSFISEEGRLVLSLEDTPVEAPGPDQILIRVEAAPMNPTDIALLTAVASMSEAVQGGTAARPTISTDLPRGLLRAMRRRIGRSLPAGSEGAGTVIAAGAGAAAQALLGRRVACLCGEMFAEYRTLDVSMCIALPDGVSAVDGAACFINPLTSLSFVEIMRREGHTALVQTAAASNLGQMLNRICLADGIPLVNIVRKPQQADILRRLGAQHVLDSTSPGFMGDLIDGIAETGATLGFDAVGGGPLAGQILTAMSVAANRGAEDYARYGSDKRTQVYVYGRLDLSPTTVPAGVGFAWNLGGYLLMPFLEEAGPKVRAQMQDRVVAELSTTFASRYARAISLREALDLDTLRAYTALATGEKYLLTPDR